MQLLLGAAVGACVAATSSGVAVGVERGAQPWMDVTLSPKQRAAALVKEMNLTEKVQLPNYFHVAGAAACDRLSANV